MVGSHNSSKMELAAHERVHFSYESTYKTMHTQENISKKKNFIIEAYHSPSQLPSPATLPSSQCHDQNSILNATKSEQVQKVSDKAPLPQEWLETTSFSKPRLSLWRMMWRCDRGLRCDVVLSTSVSGNSHFWHLTTPLQIQCPSWVVETLVTGVVTSLVIDLYPWVANRSRHHWHFECPSLLSACWLASFY